MGVEDGLNGFKVQPQCQLADIGADAEYSLETSFDIQLTDQMMIFVLF